ncbi:hypothetical protein [Leisingera sp. F5]|uniref:hypothetical protein n=1 Tax=Leisingera sp. F5 TaxID=1813816 RepID=UPI000AD68A3C|nr:hypothetical protein [Leisingera sp. F5]
MFRLGYFVSAGAALALAANLAFTPPAAAHDSGRDTARAIAGLIALGLIAKNLNDRNDRHRGYTHSYQPRTYYRPHRGHGHYAGRHRNHDRGIHRHRTRHGGYYRHRH